MGPLAQGAWRLPLQVASLALTAVRSYIHDITEDPSDQRSEITPSASDSLKNLAAQPRYTSGSLVAEPFVRCMYMVESPTAVKGESENINYRYITNDTIEACRVLFKL